MSTRALQNVTPAFRDALRHGAALVNVVEFYLPSEVDPCNPNAQRPVSATDARILTGPERAVGRFATECVAWRGLTYEPLLISDFTIERNQGREIDNVDLSFDNTSRQMARWALSRRVEGLQVVIRTLAPDAPGSYMIRAVMRAGRPTGFTNTAMSIPCEQNHFGLEKQVPFRKLGRKCWKRFGGVQCLGPQTLAQKSAFFQSQFAAFGASGCDKTHTACTQRSNEALFGGLRFQTVSGTFTYTTTETVRKFFFFKKKKTVSHNEQFSSAELATDDQVIPIAFGRVQTVGIPLQWVDKGTTLDALQAFCEGKIGGFLDIQTRAQNLTLSGPYTQHLGEYGNTGTQTPDPRFPQSGAFSELAMIGASYTGSSPTTIDETPLTTAIIHGLEIETPDPAGNFIVKSWTDDPASTVRAIFTDARLGNMPKWFWNDTASRETALACARVIEDNSQTDRARLPQAEQPNLGNSFRRFRSTGQITPYALRYRLGQVNPGDPTPDTEDPYIEWFDPLYPPALVAPATYLRKLWTFNGLLKEEVSLLDYLYKTVLPSHLGYLVTGWDGRLEHHVEQAADTAFTRQATLAGQTLLPVDDIRPFLANRDGWLLMGNGTRQAEIGKVVNYQWSTACNDLALAYANSGSLTLSGPATFSGGSASTPATAFVNVGGTPSAGSQIAVTLDGVPINYVAQTGDTLESVALMLATSINANPTLRRYIDATAFGATVRLLCASGYLELAQPLKFSHEALEENIRVDYVFEECGDAGLDNIIKGSVSWLEEQPSSVNQVEVKFYNAIDDYAPTLILREATEHLEFTGKPSKYEYDGGGIDNAHQATRVANYRLLYERDADAWFKWRSFGEANLIQLGAIVAVRHDALGDAPDEFSLNYIPLRIRGLRAQADWSVEFTGQLYLGAMYSDDVRPSEPSLPSTLTPDANAGNNAPPVPQGGPGPATGGTSFINAPPPPSSGGNGYYGGGFTFGRGGGYSPDGLDIA